jgi:carboxymethylenebutenolidase
MNNFIKLKSADGFDLPVYVAEPAGKPRAAIVVLQEIFGVNSHIRAVAERFAAEGYLALAPALFERVEPGVELGYAQADIEAGIALKNGAAALPGEGVMADIQAAIDHAAAQTGGPVGIVGFCWGGLLTWRAACMLRGVGAAVPYYGGGMTSPDDIAPQPRCPVLAHFGEQDKSIALDSVARFREMHAADVEVQLYAAGHGFNCDQRSAYDAPAAQRAWQRTLAFLSSKLAGTDATMPKTA